MGSSRKKRRCKTLWLMKLFPQGLTHIQTHRYQMKEKRMNEVHTVT